MLSVHSKCHTREIILGESGEREILQKKIAVVVLSIQNIEVATFIVWLGFFALTVY